MSFYGHKKQESSYGGGSWSLPPLPLDQTVLLHVNFALRGARDSVEWRVARDRLAIDKVAQANVVKSTLLQGIVLCSAVVIKPILRRATTHGPGTGGVSSSILYVLFHVFWLYPVAAIATYYSGLLRPSPESARRGGMANARPANGGAPGGGIMSKIIAESYRTLVTVNYFAFFFALRLVPFVGPFLAFFYACIVDAYYCFEQHWLRNGWPFDDRVRHIEQRWAYALGFGFPITFLSYWSSDPIVNLAVFALLYPAFQLTSTVAVAQPLDPALPSTSSTAAAFLAGANANAHVPATGASFSIAAAEGGSEDRGRKGSPFVPQRVRALVLADVGYKSLRAAFGGGGGGGFGGGGGGRKKDAGGHGHHGGGIRSSLAKSNPYGGGSDGGAGYPSSSVAASSPYGAGPGIDPYGGGGGGASAAPQRSAYGSAYAPPPSSFSSSEDPYAAAATSATATTTPYAGHVPQATPPRRGHAMTDSADASASPYGSSSPYSRYGGGGGGGNHVSGMGYGGDKHLDNLLRAAGGRKKGD
ncbi:hypothetical protein JCM11491_005998 [Sporobolomyces phaffii]